MATVTRGTTYGSTETITNAKLHILVDAATVTGIVNADVSAGAAIDASKLDLTGSGYVTTGANNAFTGDNSFVTADINGGTIDATAIGATTPAAAKVTTLTTGGKLTAGANEVEGSAFDINGGTMDGVQIGGTTATGELIVNNSSDDADGLGSQGSATEVLTSAGAGANPTWEAPSTAELGAWTTGSKDSSTQAATDGFLIVVSGAAGATGKFTIKTDAGSTPTTVRCEANVAHAAQELTLTCPVKKDDYWLAEDSADLIDKIFWIPLG